MTNAAILAAIAAIAALLFWPRVSGSRGWRATVTPLASIIGSGFLVLGPLLTVNYGQWAPLVMLLLCLAAWAFGAAIRANIATIEAGRAPRGGLVGAAETASSWVLAFAYVISVAYYLNLFGHFGVSLTPFDSDLAAQLLASAVYLFNLGNGWLRGFGRLELMEKVSVAVKLAIIAGLVVGLAIFVGGLASDGGLNRVAPALGGWPAVMLAFGLIVTVQGFETSRYLGGEYDAATRIRSMRRAQLIATGIYIVYIALLAPAFPRAELRLTETAIIDLMRVVAPILPLTLVAAALAAQFSAAVADTGGAGGLFAELTGGRLSERQGYVFLTAIGLVLTWTTDVFSIIAYASRAFAAYYALQAVVAALNARARGRMAPAAGWAALALLGLAMALLGEAAEGSPGEAG